MRRHVGVVGREVTPGDAYLSARDSTLILDGASDLLEQLFGDRGHHARSAIGLRALPSNVSVEIELIVQVS